LDKEKSISPKLRGRAYYSHDGYLEEEIGE